jgi:hypothetical protein
MTYRLTDEQMKNILIILSSGQRAELIPLKNHVEVVEISRRTVK